MTTLELLTEVRKLLSDPNHWTPQDPAVTAFGRVCLPCDPAAVKWSVRGAIHKLKDDRTDLRMFPWFALCSGSSYAWAMDTLDTLIADHQKAQSRPAPEADETTVDKVNRFLEEAGVDGRLPDGDDEVEFTRTFGRYSSSLRVDEDGDVWLSMGKGPGPQYPVHLPDDEAIKAACVMMRIWDTKHQGA